MGNADLDLSSEDSGVAHGDVRTAAFLGPAPGAQECYLGCWGGGGAPVSLNS